ncbi:glycerate kinase family protein [Liquorilactobacillus mali]|uniref:glycerate kinase family protein n=1 Tax=Liquorilactobacillus mali TaxID=1618 RepID=UPI00295459F5|nr:glycerate kinase [Liquorilactobacillus mali]MDV7757310.1 glycerate kinase [Liquorilactobacillus mali]
MKFVIAPDSFKGSLTAKEVALAIKKGISKIFPTAIFELVPMADGGEGTVQSLVDATDGTIISKEVTGPLGNKVTAKYGLLGNSKTAVIEMAEASGIGYIDKATANPLITTTFGTGQLIIDALDHNVEEIILGIGGSATNDGGAGMAQAIGVHLLDAKGKELPFGGAALAHLAKIDTSNIDDRLTKVKIVIASDVTNPLTGKNGASAVFGPQKGATPKMVQQLDKSLIHYSEILQKSLNKDVAALPGAGAAGGLGAGMLAFTTAQMKHGIDIVVNYTNLKNKVHGVDFVITGEGGIDFQTQYGKTPFGVAQASKSISPNIPVIALAGYVGKDIDVLYQDNVIDAIFSTVSGAKSLERAFKDGQNDITQTSENIARLINVLRS